MAGSITQDLIDISLAESATGWTGLSGQLDSEVFKEGANAWTYQTPKNAVGSATFTPAANINMTANYTTPHLYWTMRCDVFPFCEAYNAAASPVSTNSGLMVRVTDGSGNYTQWHVSGSDIWDGSWALWVLDLTNTTNVHSTSGTLSLADVDIITWYTDNSNSGNIRIIDNTWLDAVRYGDGLIASSAAAEAFSFQDIADDDALTANWYGVIQETDGVLFCQGKLVIGTDTGDSPQRAANFVSSGETVYFPDRLVSTSHYAIVGKAAAVSSPNYPTDISISGLVTKTVGTQGAEVDFSDTDINSLAIDGSTFIDMGTMQFLGNGSSPVSATITNNVFNGCGTTTFNSSVVATGNGWTNCGQITGAGATLSDSSVTGYTGATGTSAVVWNVATDPDGFMDNMAFTKGAGTTHAIEFGLSSPTTMTLRGIEFTNYGDGSPQDDAVFHFKRTSGTVTLNLVGCTATNGFSYVTDGASVDLVEDPVTITVTATTSDGTPIENARVLLKAISSSPEGPFPVSETVTIARTGSPLDLAVVTHTAHGLASNDKVVIDGANEAEYNGVKTITVVNANSYSYTCSSSPLPGTPATGTITATFAPIYGLTNASGQITTSRVYPSNQAVLGWARKSSASPYYQQGILTGEVNSTTGYNSTAVMISDE